MKPDKDRVRDILSNWSRWARDCPPDPAEVHYYTISPMFRDVIPKTGSQQPYDVDAADMVEEVLRTMRQAYPKCRELIILYWIQINSERALADALGMSKTTLHNRRMFAEGVFADFWELLFYRD